MPISGPDWVHKFPQSNSVDDLAEPFRGNVNRFLSALSDAGATVSIAATLRPPERAYLMHFSFLIARAGADPSTVPAMPGVDIQWAHDGAQAAAEAMVRGYDIVFQPALASRHTQGLAIDMDITWQDDLTMTDANGVATTISGLPRSGGNSALQAVGNSYGVKKLATDPPHWSSDGH
jgi:hypothetical protein